MSYENPQVPHEVNVSRESLTVEFVRLVAGIGVCVLAITAVLYVAGSSIARLIPFGVERDWVGDRVIGVDMEPVTTPTACVTRLRLQSLTDVLAAHLELPADRPLQVHFADTDVPNAFATLGGHIVVTRGLYERMPSENALAMVLAHEIGHVRARDPIAGAAGGAMVGLVMAAVTGSTDSLASQIANVVLLGHSRRAETAADEAAIRALRRHYGHVGGADALFEVLAGYGDAHGANMPSLLSTHPADRERIERVRAAAVGWDAQRDPLVPLVPALSDAEITPLIAADCGPT